MSIAGANQLVNRIAIDFGYRFPRVTAEPHAIGSDYVNAGTIAAFVDAGGWFLQRVASASGVQGGAGSNRCVYATAVRRRRADGLNRSCCILIQCHGHTSPCAHAYRTYERAVALANEAAKK